MDDLLYYILRCEQNDVAKYIKRHLEYYNYNSVESNEQYIYAKGDIPVLLVAHMDTVHHKIPEQIFYDKEQNVIWSPQGIGGDDRAGVYAILKITEKLKPHVLLLKDEEKGGIGAQYATEFMKIPNVNFMIELDRRGSEDAVFYDCGNDDFKDYILSFGFIEEYGTFSDISILSPTWDIASVNLSIGYYNEHSFAEYLNLNDLENTIQNVKKILLDRNNTFYDFQEIPRISYLSQYNYDDEEDLFSEYDFYKDLYE